MKTCFKLSILGLLLFAVVAVTNQTAYAQDDKTALYIKVTDNWNGDLEQRKIAVKAGKEYLAKYGSDSENQAVIDWLKGTIPSLEDGIKAEEELIKKQEEEKRRREARQARLKKFDSAYTEKRWQNAFDAGADILNAEPDFYDVAIVLASRAYTEALNGDDKHNDEALRYAKLAIDKMKAGEKSKSGFFGGYDFQYKTSEFDTPERARTNALGWMNFYIGWIKFYRQNKKDEAVPYFFEATKLESGAKDYEITYRAIGAWYVSKLSEILNKRNALLAERNAAAEADEPDEMKVKELDVKIDSLIAMERGYAERAIDAYSRTYSALSKEDKMSEYGKKTFARLQELHKLRYPEKQEMQSDSAINMNIAMIEKRAMPDPTKDVEPIDLVKPVDPADKPEDGKAGSSRSRTVSERKPAGSNN